MNQTNANRPVGPEDVRDMFRAVPPPPGLARWRAVNLDEYARTGPGRSGEHTLERRPPPWRARWAALAFAALITAAVVNVVPVAARIMGPHASPAGPSIGSATASSATEPAPTSSPPVTPSSPGPSGTSTRPSPSATRPGVPQGTTLRPYDGDLVVKTAGTVVDGRLVRGSIIVEAANVTIRRTRVAPPASAPWVIRQTPEGANLTIEDSEIVGAGKTHVGIGQETPGLKVRRCDVSGVDVGVAFGSGSTVTDSSLHDVQAGVGSNGDASTVLIKGNTITTTRASGEAAIGLYTQDGPQRDVTVEGNVIAGGNYTLHVGEGPGEQRIVVRGNRFSRALFTTGGRYGPVAGWDPKSSGNSWQNNVWADTGAPVPAA